MKTELYLSLFFITVIYSEVIAQQDPVRQSTYFLEQSALPSTKGSLVYNNYYVFANSLSYTIIENLRVSVGVLITPSRPPLYAIVQYTFPIANKLYVGGSMGYYQLEYDKSGSSQVIIPQVLITTGNPFNHTSFSVGVVRGHFLFGSGIFTPSPINLPSKVNLLMSLSHRRPIAKSISLITQNAYISADAPAGSRYSEILLFSLGGAWQIKKMHSS
jgi:hypothetical protein